jgi:hypothetical protein
MVDHAQLKALRRREEWGFGDGDDSRAFIMETLLPLAPFDNISAIARIRMRRPVSGGGASKRFTDKETPALASANTDGKCSCEAGVGKGKAAENEIIILKGVRNQAAMQHITLMHRMHLQSRPKFMRTVGRKRNGRCREHNWYINRKHNQKHQAVTIDMHVECKRYQQTGIFYSPCAAIMGREARSQLA